jgi:hypothetical protein
MCVSGFNIWRTEDNAVPRQAGLPVARVHWMVHCCHPPHSKAHHPPRTGLLSFSCLYLSYNVVQFSVYCSNPLLLILQPIHTAGVNVTLGHLPIKAYEPTIEIRDRAPRSVYIEAPFTVETGEAERIAVDTTARGGEGGTSSTFTSPSIGPLLHIASQLDLIFKRNELPSKCYTTVFWS